MTRAHHLRHRLLSFLQELSTTLSLSSILGPPPPPPPPISGLSSNPNPAPGSTRGSFLGSNLNTLSARKDTPITPGTKMKQPQWDKQLMPLDQLVFTEPAKLCQLRRTRTRASWISFGTVIPVRYSLCASYTNKSFAGHICSSHDFVIPQTTPSIFPKCLG